MPHKITPSKQKFGVAKRAAQELLKIYGNNLKAVFVAGSVASNMALPKSDIDIGFIFGKNCPTVVRGFEIQEDLRRKLGIEISPSFYSKIKFERDASWRYHVMGIIPVFDRQDYLKGIISRHGLAPNMEFIKARYSGIKSKLKRRTSFKRSIAGRKRFLPR